MHDPDINRCVEQLCEQGCQSVRQAIRHLSAGEAPAATRRLSPEQRREVLRELRTIMSIYDQRESDCD